MSRKAPAAQLVSAGGFRVDRKKALEKLMRFQLPDARMFLLSWVQAAVAAGAKRIAFGSDAEGPFMRFDGDPWPEADLKDPYSAFFTRAKGRRGDRASSFAIGLLSALRLGMEVRLRSGGHELSVRSLDAEALSPLSRPEPGTVIRAEFGSAELEFVRSHCRWCPAAIILSGEKLEAPVPAGPVLEFRGGGRRGRVWLAPADARLSEARLLVHGVLVSTQEWDSPVVPVHAVLEDDGLKLDLSNTRVVRGARLNRDLSLVTRQAGALVERAIERAVAEAGTIGRGLNAGDWYYWDDLLHGVLPEGWAGSGTEDSRRVREFSLIAAALRRACLKRLKDLEGRRKGLAARLWEAPLAFDVERRPLSLKDIESLRRAVGHVPVSDRDSPVANGTALWLLRSADRTFFDQVFPGSLRPVRRAWGGDRIDTVRLLGDRMLVSAAMPLGQGEARLGLSSQPRAGASRLKWLLRGRAPASTELELDGLRVDAVLDLASLEAPPAAGSAEARSCAEGIRAAAPALFQELSRLYRPLDETPVQAAIREHLLDFMAASGKDWPDWLERARVFRDVQGRMLSKAELLEMSSRGLKPVLISPPHPASIAGVARGRPDRVRELVGEAKWLGGLRTLKLKGRRARPAPGVDFGPGAFGSGASLPSALTPEERVERLKKKLKRLLPAAEDALSLEAVAALRVYPHADEHPFAKAGASWAVAVKNPLVVALLDMADHEAADAFLASLLFSAVNRESTRVSDADEIAFQTAVARLVLES